MNIKTSDETQLIRTVRRANDSKPDWVLNKIDQAVAQALANGTVAENVRIACLELAYKADLDDLRESPVLSIVQDLADKYHGVLL